MIYEILEITLFRARNVANGYSGAFDWGDVAAYGVGLGLIIGNYYALRAWCYKHSTD